MNRRSLLAAGVTGLSLLAGCAGRPGSPTDGPTDGTPTTTTDGGETPSRFLGEPCPSFREGVDSTRCHHDGDAAGYTVDMEPSAEVIDATADTEEIETITFELANDSDGAVGLNPHDWRIHRRADDGWRKVAPEAYPEPWERVGSGESYRWELSLQSHPTPDEARTMQVVEDLADGVHAFSIAGTLDEDAETPTRVEWIALFEVIRDTGTTDGRPDTTTGTDTTGMA